MASVLFLAPADLGETVLATGALAHVLGEGDELTILSGAEAQQLFRAAPGLAALHPWNGRAGFGAWVDLAWRRLRRPFDLVIDLSGSPASFAIPAKRRLQRRAPQLLRHLSEELSELAGAERTCPPVLWLDDAARAAAAAVAPDAALLVLAPGGVTETKRWPRERFAAVARRLVTGPLARARVVVLGAAERDAAVTRAIVSSLDADGVPALDLGEGLDLLAAAALMERATLCIGNDNALTHIAAAMGAPTLTLFGPTDERVRAPYGPRARTLRGRTLEEIAAAPQDAARAMEDLSIDAVEAAALDLLHAGGLR